MSICIYMYIQYFYRWISYIYKYSYIQICSISADGPALLQYYPLSAPILAIDLHDSSPPNSSPPNP